MADKLLLLLAARGGVPTDVLREQVSAAAARLSEMLAAAGGGARAFLRQEGDPFRRGGPPMRGFDATLELRAAGPGAEAALLGAARGADERLSGLVHVDLCAALLGSDHVIVPCPPTPVRYQYVMRRRRDLTHAQYADHYLKVHAGYGREAPGIAGYVQFHVEPEASRRAAASAGVGLWSADSVSELHLASTAEFLAGISRWQGRDRAMADENAFVDRANSVMFVSDALELAG